MEHLRCEIRRIANRWARISTVVQQSGAAAVSPLRSIVPRLLRASSTTASLCTARRSHKQSRAQRESNRGSRAPTARGGRACRPPRPHAWAPDYSKRALLAKSSFNRWQTDTRSPYLCRGWYGLTRSASYFISMPTPTFYHNHLSMSRLFAKKP